MWLRWLICMVNSTSYIIKIRWGCKVASSMWKGPTQSRKTVPPRILMIWIPSFAFHRLSLSRLDSRDFDLTLQNESLGKARLSELTAFYPRCSKRKRFVCYLNNVEVLAWIFYIKYNLLLFTLIKKVVADQPDWIRGYTKQA